MPCRLATSAALQTGQLSDGGVADEAIALSTLCCVLHKQHPHEAIQDLRALHHMHSFWNPLGYSQIW